MRFGLFLMPEPFPWSNWTVSYDLKLEEIVKAEHLTYDEVWVGEHHTGAYENIPAPDIFLGKASALTHRIALGTGTVNLPYRDPFDVAPPATSGWKPCAISPGTRPAPPGI